MSNIKVIVRLQTIVVSLPSKEELRFIRSPKGELIPYRTGMCAMRQFLAYWKRNNTGIGIEDNAQLDKEIFHQMVRNCRKMINFYVDFYQNISVNSLFTFPKKKSNYTFYKFVKFYK